MSDKKSNTKNTAEKSASKSEHTFAFSKENYMLMGIGVVVLIIGFWLMSGKEDIFSNTKLTIAPIVIVIGLAIEFVAIMRKPKD
ncbi:MAG: DUF3098 domain-containing protein [Bacteroidota bacterium]